MSNGDFTRYLGSQPNRVQWTGSGGFAAVDGELNVRLSNGQTLKWGSGSFVPNDNALVFGSSYATDKVNFQNNIDLNGGTRTILVKANDAGLSGAEANTDHVIMNGVISNRFPNRGRREPYRRRGARRGQHLHRSPQCGGGNARHLGEPTYRGFRRADRSRAGPRSFWAEVKPSAPFLVRGA